MRSAKPAGMWPGVRSRDRLPVLVILVMVWLLWSPLLDGYWFQSHEFDAYVVRTHQFLASMQEGIAYPRWADEMYGGYGSPFFIFYPPLVYGCAAFAAWLLGSVVLGLKLAMLGATLSAGLGAYALGRAEIGRRDAALVVAGVYLAAPYRITDLSVRGDLAEYTAVGLLPVVLWCYRRCAGEADLRRASGYAMGAALAHAALVLSHTLLGLWSTWLIASIVAMTFVQTLRRRAYRHAALLSVAFIFAMALSAVYTLPALLEKHLVRLDAMDQGYNDPAHQWLTWSQLNGAGQFFFAPVVAAVGASSALSAFLRRPGGGAALAWSACAGVALLLVLPHASPFWAVDVPLLSMIQFPWRLLGLGWLALAMAAGYVWGGWGREAHVAGTQLAAVCVVLACVLARPLASIDPIPRGRIRDDLTAIRGALVSTTGVDEYLPRVVRHEPEVPQAQPVQSNPDTTVHHWTSSPSRHAITLSVSESRSVTLRLHYFPGWRLAQVSGPGGVELGPGEDGRVSLRFAAPGRYSVVVAFGATPVRRWAGVASLLALLLLWPCLRGVASLRDAWLRRIEVAS